MKLGPIPAWLGITVSAPLAVVAIPVVAGGFALAGLAWLKRRAIGPTKQWSRWLAWYPVNVGDHFDPDWRWMEIVERRSFAIMSDTSYRTPPT
jgi:hypothetical protein